MSGSLGGEPKSRMAAGNIVVPVSVSALGNGAEAILVAVEGFW